MQYELELCLKHSMETDSTCTYRVLDHNGIRSTQSLGLALSNHQTNDLATARHGILGEELLVDHNLAHLHEQVYEFDYMLCLNRQGHCRYILCCDPGRLCGRSMRQIQARAWPARRPLRCAH